MNEESPSPRPLERRSSGKGWAIAMAFLIMACLVLPILLIRSAMTRVRSLGGAAESALITARSIAEAFRTNRLETTLKSYATQIHGVSKFQVAELKQDESFERTDSASLAWGTIPLPDVVIEARARVIYTYVLDLQKRWELKLEGGRVDVLAPALEFTAPALDPSSLTFEVKRGSVLRDEEAVRSALQAGLTGFLNQRAREHLSLVRETGRKTTEDFVRVFLISHYDDAQALIVKVRFADEPAPESTPRSLTIIGGSRQ